MNPSFASISIETEEEEHEDTYENIEVIEPFL
jgi:hypothetical protein